MANNELTGIAKQFVDSGWDVIDAPAKVWLAATTDLIAAAEKADTECGSCGCEMDPLYKKALNLLREL